MHAESSFIHHERKAAEIGRIPRGEERKNRPHPFGRFERFGDCRYRRSLLYSHDRAHGLVFDSPASIDWIIGSPFRFRMALAPYLLRSPLLADVRDMVCNRRHHLRSLWWLPWNRESVLRKSISSSLSIHAVDHAVLDASATRVLARLRAFQIRNSPKP